jgi:His/Glu/Gln/Arg/opine family amino acid ABC transporter permease subunit
MGDSIVKFLETWSPIDIVLIAQNFDRFLWGALTTLELTIISLIVGGILSIPLAIIRAGNNPFLNAPVWVFTYVFRGTPLLVQTYLIYYGLGQFEWIRETFLWGPILSQAWYCALIAFSLNTAAYTTELLRGSIVNTNRGEVEAAKACGFSSWMRMRRIAAYCAAECISTRVTGLFQRSHFHAARVGGREHDYHPGPARRRALAQWPLLSCLRGFYYRRSPAVFASGKSTGYSTSTRVKRLKSNPPKVPRPFEFSAR